MSGTEQMMAPVAVRRQQLATPPAALPEIVPQPAPQQHGALQDLPQQQKGAPQGLQPPARLKPHTMRGRIGRYRNKTAGALLVALLTGLAALSIFPMVLTFTNSFMPEGEISNNYAALSPVKAGATIANSFDFVRLQWIPDLATLSQYYNVLVKEPQFLSMFWNSVKMTAPIIAGQIAVAALAGYAFSHLRFRFREPLFLLYIVTMLMPFQVTLVPNYIVADRLGLINSYASIIFPGIFSAFGVFLLRQFMQAVPASYIEAARVDGASHFYIFARIVLPMCTTGVAALAILVFIDNWNMVEQPLVFLQDAVKQPLSVYLSVIGDGERGIAFAASALYMTPLILTALYAENYLVEGIQLTGIKG